MSPTTATLGDSGQRDGQPAPGLFRNRSFLLLWAAYGISASGDHIGEMAVLKSLNAMNAPNLTQLQALITFMFMLPFFILGPLNGMLADRLPRRGLMITADLIRAALLFNFAFLLALFPRDGAVWIAFIPLLLVGLFASMFSPARAALLPTLIQQDQLVRANAMTGGLGVIATMTAALIGGYLADHYRPQVAFTVDAFTFLGSTVLLLILRTPARERQRRHSETGFLPLADAVRYVRQHRRVGQLIAVATVVWLGGATVRSIIPALVRDVYGHREYFQMTLFQGRLAAGMLTGALLLTALGNALRSEVAITWSLFGIGLSIGTLAFSALAPVPPSLAHSIGGVSIIMAGVFGAGVMASYSALLQRIVPNRLRGRLFGLTDLCTVGGLLLVTGALAIPSWRSIDRWLGPILLGVSGIVLAAGAISLSVRLRSAQEGPTLAFWRNVNEFYCKWWFRLRRAGPCTVPPEGPVIVIANHTSSIDPVLLVASIRHRAMGFLIAEEFANLPFGGFFVRLIECIPVKRDSHDAASTKAALRHLKKDKLLGIFIEGKIARPGEVLEAKDGAAMLALRTGSLVVPAYISGTNWHESMLKTYFFRHRAVVRFGKPIDLRGHVGDSKPDKATITSLSAMLLAKIRELGDLPDES